MYYAYSVWQWVLVFYLYCFLGWCFESTVVSVSQRRWVNRGFLRGPMLPIYGFGATILLHIALPLRAHPAALFLASMAAATVFEYLVGVLMETLFKVKYWDYSTHRFQFQGRICLQSSLCWGAMGLLLTHFLHPPLEKLVVGLPFWLLLALDVLLSAAFLSDVAVSVRTALDLARVLEELDKLREQGAALRQQLSETAMVQLTNLSYRVDEARGEWSERVDEARGQLAGRMEEAREELADRWDDASERTKVQLTNLSYRVDEARSEWTERMDHAYDQVTATKEQLLDRLDELQRRFDERADSLSRSRKSMLRGNPSARSKQYDDVLQRLKKHMDAHKRG
ncbi:putative ABC transporter permease [Agathobaculum desmolans]|uniref:putative ABC transporter permease n=1 Tax=Agathobaculum desmolans TaxID=39484 RepID=UPI00248E9040|nr:hypothetical protein [Agathobaculum desmolans]